MSRTQNICVQYCITSHQSFPTSHLQHYMHALGSQSKMYLLVFPGHGTAMGRQPRLSRLDAAIGSGWRQ